VAQVAGSGIVHRAHELTAGAGLFTVSGAPDDYDRLLAAVGDASVVLIGEASHGTHEFYRERARITRRLIDELGFHAVAIEGDWPDAARVDRYVRGGGRDRTAAAALGGFRRFPSWMWRNTVVADFVSWLRARNSAERSPERRCGFYGLDLYSMRTSMDAVVEYLAERDPAAAAVARLRYSCFDQVGLANPDEAGQQYGYAVRSGALDPCEDEVVAQLLDLRESRAALVRGGGSTGGLVRGDEAAAEEADAFFDAERNARLVHDAERYYRAMYHGRASSWNLRDTHMMETLAELRLHLSSRVHRPRIVVWAHNSHVGDARATELGRPTAPTGQRQHTLGQLARQRWPGETFLLGLTTSGGTVTAAADWGGPMTRMPVLPARPGSIEHVLGRWEVPAFYCFTGELALGPDGTARVGEVLLQRAIGVIYRPQTERASHWFGAAPHDEFDAVLHIDTTTALEPLDRTARWDRGEAPETYPTGL
jgi:erythromycin esterase-like protein